jgi:hypothetical protein
MAGEEEDDDEPLTGFGPPAILIPEPIAFPRAAYTAALAHHAELLALHQDSLLFQARTFGPRDQPPLAFIDQLAGLIEVRRDSTQVLVVRRAQLVAELPDYRGVVRALHLNPGAWRLRVVVLAEGVVSLHTLEVDRSGAARGPSPRLVVVARDVVVEPSQQKHRREGPWTITRWATPDGPRYAWVPTPAEPPSGEEAIDRALALYGVEVRRRVWDFMRRGYGASDAFVQLMSSELLGDSIGVIPRRNHIALTALRPTISRAIDADTRPGWVPLFFHGSRWMGLRWIEVRAAGEEPPADVVQARHSLHLVPDAKAAAPETEAVPSAPRAKLSDAELLDAIFQMGVDDAVDRLVTLTDAELDREIADAGFDPAAERATGPGLRERVVRALADRELERNPPAPG